MKKRLFFLSACTIAILMTGGCGNQTTQVNISDSQTISASDSISSDTKENNAKTGSTDEAASDTASDDGEVNCNDVDNTNSSTENASDTSATEENELENDTISSKNNDWSVVKQTDLTQATNIEGFLNENFGITVGYAGAIFYTNDGTTTWTQGKNSSMCRFCLDIIDENIAWCGGNGNQVRVTTDGGANWTEVTDITLGGKHSNIDFIDDTTGWISNNKKLASTTDGGANWTELALPEGAKSVACFQLRTTNDVYLMTHNGQFFVTADGGATWSKKTDIDIASLGVVNEMGSQGQLAKYDTAVADIAFTDENNGTIVMIGVVPNEGSKLWCVTTSDGGATWTTEEIELTGAYTINHVFLSKDGNYITLGNTKKKTVVLKRSE